VSARRLVLVAVVLVLGAPAIARAQATPYTATPPTAQTLYRDGQTGRYLLGGEWLYRADPTAAGVAQQWYAGSSTAAWSPVTVPNSFNAGDFSSGSMVGSVGWYRRDFTLPTGAFGPKVPASLQRWIVRFESVNYRATVWLNGRQIGSHVDAYVPFEIDLNGLRAGVNRLIVRVDSRRGPGDLPPGPSGGWWNFGGMLGEVYLRAVDAADLSEVQVTPVLPCPTCAATIQETATVRNVTGAAHQVALTGRYGSVPLDFGTATIAPHQSWTATSTAVVPQPQLWSTDTPRLYRATLTLSDQKGNRLGGYVTYSGIRTIAVTTGGQLALNGRLLHLRGAFIHQQNVQTGAALSIPQMTALMGWEHELGSTVIRSHYPLPPAIQELADRMGILIWSEVPVYQVADPYLGQPGWRTRAYSFLQQNILASENHPSVMLWSIANELPTPVTANEAGYISGAAALARKLDPTRPVGMAISDWPGVPCQAAYAPLGVIGFNDYFGWFDAGGGGTDDRDQLGPFLDSLRGCYPTQAIMVTEFGFEANRHGPVEERGTYEFQSDSAAYHLGVFATKSWLSGAIYFALQNFASRPGWGGGNPWPDPPWVQKGLVDQLGNLKPAFAVVSTLFHAVSQIAPMRRVAPRPAHPKRRRPAHPKRRRPAASRSGSPAT
jgi:beta-glucuronidase